MYFGDVYCSGKRFQLRHWDSDWWQQRQGIVYNCTGDIVPVKDIHEVLTGEWVFYKEECSDLRTKHKEWITDRSGVSLVKLLTTIVDKLESLDAKL